MKKFTTVILTLAIAMCLFSGCKKTEVAANAEPPVDVSMWKIAVIADPQGSLEEQAAVEGCEKICNAYDIAHGIYAQTGDSTAERVEALEKAIADGCNVLVLPADGCAGGVIAETIEAHPNVKYIALNASEFDLQDANGHADDFGWAYPENLYACTFHEEIAGYLAGYAAVKMGYEKLGFMGGMAVPSTVRYGFGFLQGCNDAAVAMGKTDVISVKYAYDNDGCEMDRAIPAALAEWCDDGTEVVFAGKYEYLYALDTAAEYGCKLIGTGVDCAKLDDQNVTITSAVLDYSAAAAYLLEEVCVKNNWEALSGKVDNLGMQPQSFIGLPMDSTLWNDSFTTNDYSALIADLQGGALVVSDNTETEPTVSISVDYLGNVGHHF